MARFKNVLLVEDDAITIMVCERIIKMTSFGEHVTSRENGFLAIEYIKQLLSSTSDKCPEVIFLDINMPVMNGWDFLEEFAKLPNKRQECCGIYILSSTVDPEDYKKATLYPSVKGFISKPLTPEHLKEIHV